MDKATKAIVVVLMVAAAVGAGVYFNQPSQAPPTSEPQTPPEQPAAQKNDPAPALPPQAAPDTAKPPDAPATKPQPKPAPPPAKQEPAPAAPTAKFASGECAVGPAAAPLRIEVFSDYECPACRRYYLETVRPLLAEYALPGRACVVYYEFPLPMHKHARQAARFGHAASMLGTEKWIQVTDALYFYQANWAASGQLEPVLAQVLNEEEMARVMAWASDPGMDELINSDVALGRSRGVTGTPTTFVTANGKTEKLPTGIIQFPILRRYLDNLLAQAQ